MTCQCVECVGYPEDGPTKREVFVGSEGVQFGKGCWISHEKITGFTAEQLNNGTAGIIGAQYMAWVRGETA